MTPIPKPNRLFRKSHRIEARLSPEQKRRIEYAAGLRGTSISEFMISSAENAAAQTIEQHEFWYLTDRDRELFVRAILRPRTPTARMRAAAQRYKKRVRAA
jgi:uncharacterized protein (DUF1778 family)